MPLTGDRKRQYQREWIAARRAEFFKGKSCVSCGSQDKLELDHIDRTTKVSHRIWSWSEARRDAEAAKCQVLCEDCHMARTIAQLSKEPVHGTLTMYTKYKCRCTECRRANRDQARLRRKRSS